MSIKQSIYDKLTPNQRLSAALEAIKRHDNKEAEKLLSDLRVSSEDIHICKTVVSGFIDLETGETYKTPEIMEIGGRKSWLEKHREKFDSISAQDKQSSEERAKLLRRKAVKYENLTD